MKKLVFVLLLALAGTAQAAKPFAPGANYVGTVTPSGSSLPWTMDHGVKVFHLIAEPVKKEIAPGMVIDAWGYNGQSPGPTIEAVEGDPGHQQAARADHQVREHLHGDGDPGWYSNPEGTTARKVDAP